jgi:hypothetical protein
MGVDVVGIVAFPDDPDLGFVLEESINESVYVGVPEVVVKHPHGEVEVLILRLLIPTVFPKAREETRANASAANGARWKKAI